MEHPRQNATLTTVQGNGSTMTRCQPRPETKQGQELASRAMAPCRCQDKIMLTPAPPKKNKVLLDFQTACPGISKIISKNFPGELVTGHELFLKLGDDCDWLISAQRFPAGPVHDCFSKTQVGSNPIFRNRALGSVFEATTRSQKGSQSFRMKQRRSAVASEFYFFSSSVLRRGTGTGTQNSLLLLLLVNNRSIFCSPFAVAKKKGSAGSLTKNHLMAQQRNQMSANGCTYLSPKTRSPHPGLPESCLDKVLFLRFGLFLFLFSLFCLSIPHFLLKNTIRSTCHLEDSGLI